VARGIDISQRVTHVINFDTPEVPNYIPGVGVRANKRISMALLLRKKNAVRNYKTLFCYTIPSAALPESWLFQMYLEDEIPKVFMKTYQVRLPKEEEVETCVPRKICKRTTKVNFVVSRKRQNDENMVSKTRSRKEKVTTVIFILMKLFNMSYFIPFSLTLFF
jgi:superfamily II DNA/RNA helicase